MAEINLKNKAEKVIIDLILGYINSLGADLTNRFLFGGKNETEKILTKVDELLKENKLGEAQAAVSQLRGRMSSLGETDEEMIFQDIMEVQRLGLVPREKARKTAQLLAGLDADQRRRIRKANMAESNSIVRQNKWAEFCNCDEDGQASYLQAFGFNDPSELQRLQSWDEETFGAQATFAEAEATVKVNEAHNQISGSRIKPRGWGWLNPFR